MIGGVLEDIEGYWREWRGTRGYGGVLEGVEGCRWV